MSTTVITVGLLRNCIDSQSGELCSNSALCATSSDVGNVLIRVQVEGIIEMTAGEDHEQMTSPLTDPGVCFKSVDFFLCFVFIQICQSLYKSALVKQYFSFCEVVISL